MEIRDDHKKMFGLYLKEAKTSQMEEFILRMCQAMATSFYKYGFAYKTYPELAQAYKCLRDRFNIYKQKRNTDYVVDIANFAMIEAMHPSVDIPGINIPSAQKNSRDFNRDISLPFISALANVTDINYSGASDLNDAIDRYAASPSVALLIEIAYMAFIEYTSPSVENAFFKGTDSKDSPGLAGGISYKQLMEYDR